MKVHFFAATIVPRNSIRRFVYRWPDREEGGGILHTKICGVETVNEEERGGIERRHGELKGTACEPKALLFFFFLFDLL